MGRQLRAAVGGLVYHVLNRSNGRVRIFEDDSEYKAFEQVMGEASERIPMRILSYCVMPNHWHMVLWPKGDGDLSRFVGWLTLTHTQRWHAHRHSAGSGHLYQGRFKSFVVEENEHLLTVCRYVERNALRAKLVERAEDWRWCSLWRRESGSARAKTLLSDWPMKPPENWLEIVNGLETDRELDGLRSSVNRGQPYGSGPWLKQIAEQWGSKSLVRPGGRPRRATNRKVPVGRPHDTFTLQKGS
jgi:putative transposase